MAYQMEFDFSGEQAPDYPSVQTSSAIDRIYEIMNHSGTPASAMSRLVAREIVSAIRGMVHEGKGWKRAPYRVLMNRVKGCRALHRNLLECKKSSAADHLDLDGPEFRFVLDKIAELFNTALNDAGVGDEFAETVMEKFECQMEANHERLRFELGKQQENEAMPCRNAAA